MTTSFINAYFQNNRKHASIDIETLGLESGNIILEIGACLFNPLTGEASDYFHVRIDEDASREAGFTEDEATARWWAERGGFPDDPTPGLLPRQAINSLEHWFRKQDPYYVWARGMDFERPMIEAYCKAYGFKLPWNPFHSRDTRTVFDLAFPNYKPKNDVHRALPDAIIQAEQTAFALRALSPLPDHLIVDRRSLPTFIHLKPTES